MTSQCVSQCTARLHLAGFLARQKTTALWKGGYSYFREWLFVASFLEVSAFLAITDYDDFLGSPLFHVFCGNYRARDVRLTNSRFFAIVNQQYLVKNNLTV